METLKTQEPKGAEFKQRVIEDWAGDETALAWQKHFKPMREQMKLVSKALTDAAELGPGMKVLDLASGPGDPALSIAALVQPGGSVCATDINPNMLSALRSNATEEGLNNIETKVADAHSLEFPDASFDRVTSRFGIMFFEDVGRALGEVRRVLKPGGKTAFLVWGAPGPGTYFGSAVLPFVKRLSEKPDPDGPGPMRFAEAGKLKAHFVAAGFSNIAEDSYNLPSPYAGTPEQLLVDLMEIAVPLRKAAETLSAEDYAAAKLDALEALRELERDGKVNVTVPAIVVTGTSD